MNLLDINPTRRDFFRSAALGLAQVAGLAAAPGLGAGLAAQERFRVDASEPWGQLLRLSEGVWAMISDPLADGTTVCNGGIIAGRSGVVLVEAFGTDAGAAWMADQAERLVGRRPSHVVLTHYHRDHVGGLGRAAGNGSVEVLATSVTRDLVAERNQNPPNAVLDAVTAIDTIRPTEIDLGDRSVLLVPRRGHTDSDVTVELPESGIVFCGDLVWNRMFPNYVDATPGWLSRTVRLLAAVPATSYVPGHGSMADAAAIARYVELLDAVEDAAREALRQGWSAAEAGAGFRLPSGTQDWTLFSDTYFERAIDAWMRELGAE